MPTTFTVSDQDAKEFRETVRSLPNYYHGQIAIEIHNAIQSHIKVLKSNKEE